MSINNRRSIARSRDQEARRKAKFEHRVQNEIARLEQVVQRRKAKADEAERKLAEAKRKAK